MKVMAMYLPQFHRVKENDEWWGEGYTEWTAVKNAKPLYEGHFQPREPLNDYYYDLSQKATMKWQADLMHKYGVDALCFYHYWFKDGKRILEKPAENLLQWKDIDMPFCFSWANESWGRTWSNIRMKNVWAPVFEEGKAIEGNGNLLEQDYGEEKDWRNHFLYLLPFFKDERYIKVDGKPLILLHLVEEIYCLEAMMCKWRVWAKEEGFPGLYIIGDKMADVLPRGLDAQAYLLRNYIGKLRSSNKLRFNYEDLWNSILMSQGSETDYYQAVVGHDTTPRRGQQGVIFENESPEFFREGLAKLMAKTHLEHKDMVFINAWNEWGEGMYLEPDKKYGYAFLEGVMWAKEHFIDFLDEMKKHSIDEQGAVAGQESIFKEKYHRYNKYWRILDAWLCLKEENKSISEHLLKKGYKNIAIYGAGMLGKHLIAELKGSETNICYLIDWKVKSIQGGYNIYLPTDSYPTDVDAVIVATVQDYEQIRELMLEKGIKKILYLENIVRELQIKKC